MGAWIKRVYANGILKNPWAVLGILALVTAFFAYQMQHFKLDASGDSLVLEGDRDLLYYQTIKEQYASDEYLILTWQPAGPMLSDESLEDLTHFTDELRQMERVASVFSILDVPLFHSPKVSLFAIATGFNTLRKPKTDRALALEELKTSPLFRDNLMSVDGKTSAIQVNFKRNPNFEKKINRRNALRLLAAEGSLDPAQASELAQLNESIRSENAVITAQQRADVAQIRSIMDQYRSQATLYLGGVPMIVADMIAFVRSDIVVFGLGVLVFLIASLAIIFRKPRWVLIPMLCCIAVELIMLGFLGWVDWRATVISSNFTSLLLIITMSMAIHMVVRYRELANAHPEASQAELVLKSTALVGLPCFYCALTTMVGFGSLVVSDIRPVIDFGKMMVVGIAVAFAVVFLLFPVIAVLLKRVPAQAASTEKKTSFTEIFAHFTNRHGRFIVVFSLILGVLGLLGSARLKVENRFIDYFKASTEIYQGMSVIDNQLGGTTPLEIILRGEGKDYWYKTENLAQLRQVHQFLDELPETGKVLSLDTMVQTLEKILGGKVNNLVFSMVRRGLPDDLKEQVLRPFISPDGSQLRLVVRVRESDKALKRQEMLDQIGQFLHQEMQIAPEKVRLTGMLVLYNNMLQSLFDSQIKTLGMVFFAILLMFWILFRSLKLAVIAIIPNLFPAVLVLGAMGWAGIPLDMMTITIAAISIGIAVDHTIHYVHRFKAEFPALGSYRDTVFLCHRSIGKAMYYTSMTIIAGFSILALSNFIPTIYFGLFTGLAMVAALVAALTLLPQLMMMFKPLGPETRHGVNQEVRDPA